MSPEMRARITAKNESAPAFGEVVRDAKMAGDAIAASGRTAAAGLRVEELAMQAVARASRLAGMQQRNLMFQLNDIGVSLAGGMNPLMVLIQQGSQIATIWGPYEGGVGRAFKETGNLLVGMVTKFWPVTAAVGALGVGIGAMTTEISRNQEVQVGWTDVVRAAWQMASESIMGAMQPVFDTIGGWWDVAAFFVVGGINNLVGLFVGAFDSIKYVWNSLPMALGDLAMQGAQSVLDGITFLLREAVSQINGFITNINGLLPDQMKMGSLGSPNSVIPGFKLDNPWAGYAGEMGMELGNNFSAAMSVDYVGALGERARQIAAARATAQAGSGSKDALKTVRDLADKGIGYLKDKTNAFAEAAQSAFSNLGTGLIEAFKKGGNVAGNVLDMLLGKVGQFGESLLNSGLNGLLNMGLNALMGGIGGGMGGGTWGQFGGFAGYSGMFGLPSYEGGGFTGSGARAGGLDGRGGRLAMLHPNETVLDHSKGQGGGGNFTFNFYDVNDLTQVRQWARQELPALVRSINSDPYAVG